MVISNLQKRQHFLLFFDIVWIVNLLSINELLHLTFLCFGPKYYHHLMRHGDHLNFLFGPDFLFNAKGAQVQAS